MSIIELNIKNKKIKIETISTFNLVNEFDFKERFMIQNSLIGKPLKDWEMCIDDAPIFRYLYRNFKPSRHLEFGTWQGEGATYCLEETNATIWTINLPFGEINAYGENVYGNNQHQIKILQEWAQKIGQPKKEQYNTDNIGFIGRKYLQNGLGNRVCQIYCDSKKWDNSNYPDDFFDSVLVDGGHTKEIVISDTRKAFEKLRKGGMILWHDFCPPVWEDFESTRGVMEGMINQWEYVVKNTEKLFWIDPSWILVGIKK